MATFKVKTPIKKDGTDYAPGDKIQLSAKEAKSLAHALEGNIGADEKEPAEDNKEEK